MDKHTEGLIKKLYSLNAQDAVRELLLKHPDADWSMSEEGGLIWCELCGEAPATHWDDLAVMCPECNADA